LEKKKWDTRVKCHRGRKGILFNVRWVQRKEDEGVQGGGEILKLQKGFAKKPTKKKKMGLRITSRKKQGGEGKPKGGDYNGLEHAGGRGGYCKNNQVGEGKKPGCFFKQKKQKEKNHHSKTTPKTRKACTEKERVWGGGGTPHLGSQKLNTMGTSHNCLNLKKTGWETVKANKLCITGKTVNGALCGGGRSKIWGTQTRKKST